MNSKQRKFIKELANLMQKHNVRFNIHLNYGSIEGYSWNVGGKETDISMKSFNPSVLRNQL